MFLTVLSPVPLVFLVIFLFRAPLGELTSSAKTLSIPAPKHPVPVVLVVLDEFAEPTLMGPNHQIDAGRFPNFAALAATSTWYRNANSVHEHTPDAVPAILTGQNPKPGALPVAQDHPDNIFTLLGSRYGDGRLRVGHPALPEQLCERRARLVLGPHHARSPTTWRSSTATSCCRSGSRPAAVGHQHVAGLQRRRARRHGGAHAAPTWRCRAQATSTARSAARCGRTSASSGTRGSTGSSPSAKPTLYMMHALMPHYPWRYLPDGKQYGSSLGIDGLGSDGDTWTTDPWVVEQGWQRHLLQAGLHRSSCSGSSIARLKAEGIWNKALVIVTADHGVSFIPGQHRRVGDAGELLGHRLGPALRQAAAPDDGPDRRRRRRHHRHRPDDRRRARGPAARRLPRRRAVAARPARPPYRDRPRRRAAARS